MELLAPAGNPQSFNKALESGANAIYLGLPWFNARRPAKNFTPETLKESLDKARERGVKVYITMNTDLKSSELRDAAKVLTLLQELKVDAVIIKDFGLYYMAKECFPGLELHLSTQFGISNTYAANEAKIMGAQRVIPARELGFNELKSIHESEKELPEIEVFAQGSMCFSFSGKCLLSSWVGGKSANRGVCQAPCRLKYDHDGKSFPYFSMKDLNLVSCLDELKKVNVSSLKIEGRLKSPGWVGNITSIYRDALNGEEVNCYDSLLKHSGREMGEGFITGLRNLTSEHSVRFGKFLGHVTDIIDVDGISYARVNFTKKDELTSLRFISEDDEFLTIIHPGDLNFKVEDDFALIKNIGKIKKDALVYEVIPSRSENTGLGRLRYDVELEIVGSDLNINLYTDDGLFKTTDKYKKVVKAKRGVYPDSVYDKLSDKVVNGWRLNRLYSEEILLSKTQVNDIVKAVSYTLAVTIPESNPLNRIKLDDRVEDFIKSNPQGKSSFRKNSLRVSFNSFETARDKNIIIDEICLNSDRLKKLIQYSREREVTISLFPIMFEKDMEELKKIVSILEKTGNFLYEINDLGHYNLLVRDMNISPERIVGGQGIACYNHLSLRYLRDEFGIKSLSIPMELDSRGVVKLVEENRDYTDLRFNTLSRVPGMYSRVKSEDFYEGAKFRDKIGTVMEVHKFRDLNIFYIDEFFSSKGCRDLEDIKFSEEITEKFCLDNPERAKKSFNLERKLH